MGFWKNVHANLKPSGGHSIFPWWYFKYIVAVVVLAGVVQPLPDGLGAAIIATALVGFLMYLGLRPPRD